MRSSAGRKVVYVVGIVAGILVPVVAGLLLGFLGPAPYLLNEHRLAPEWSSHRTFADGSSVVVRTYPSPAEARQGAEAISQSIPTSSSSRTLNVRRYTRADDQRRGLLLPVGSRVVQVEAADAGAVDARLRGLPFIRENPEKNVMWVLFTEHLGAVLAGLALYVLAFGYVMARGASWAWEVLPAPGVAPVPAETLRSRLLALNDLGLPFQVREEPDGRLVAEWRSADAEWAGLMESGGLRDTHRVHLDLDPGAHRVRNVDEHVTVSWSGGIAHVSASFSFFRGISLYDYRRGVQAGLFFRDGRWRTKAYDYRFLLSEMKSPLVEAVTGSGWTFTPVVAFFRPLARRSG